MSTLNDYEAEQVHEIAHWKSERPSLLLESYRNLIRPLSRLISHIVPKDLVMEAVVKVESLAEVHDLSADILTAGGIASVHDLLNRSLEECDRLSRMVSARAEHAALLEGVVPAAAGVVMPEGGGAVAAALDVPILLEATIRVVRRIGHCYGFPLDSEYDRRFVLAILDIANEGAPAGQEEIRLRLWDPAGPTEKRPEGSDVTQAIQDSVVDDLPIESIPVVGDVANLVLDYAFVRRADLTARRVFQERWLQANSKVESIPPSPEFHRRSSIEGIVAVGSEVVYAGAYGVSFGVTFPTILAGLVVESVAPDSVFQGVRDGASAASGDSRKFLDRHSKSVESRSNGVLAPAASG
jgi:EcsC protein family